MIIDYNKISKNEIVEMKGGVGSVFVKKYEDERNTIMRITLPPSSSIGFHIHENTQEIVYIISGKAKVIETDKTHYIEEGMSNYCKINKSHSIVNEGAVNVEAFAVVTKLI